MEAGEIRMRDRHSEMHFAHWFSCNSMPLTIQVAHPRRSPCSDSKNSNSISARPGAEEKAGRCLAGDERVGRDQRTSAQSDIVDIHKFWPEFSILLSILLHFCPLISPFGGHLSVQLLEGFAGVSLAGSGSSQLFSHTVS